MLFTRTLLSIALVLAPLASTSPVSNGDTNIAVGSERRDTISFQDDESVKRAVTYKCPVTNNGVGRIYEAHEFTENQVTAALAAAKAIQEKKGPSWKPAANDYPHYFGNREKLPFDNCGKDKVEFPILTNNQIYAFGAPVATVPDRIVYEFSWKKNSVRVKICGVIRHGPNPDFLNCPS
ncbi:hypothetical protein GGR54DRAFT_607444 [Hypoxylon sp. NC1633]|nr:hypothetical protein GGR54DRAFT_607444 [Hypoxylon sp. NC1633]